MRYELVAHLARTGAGEALSRTISWLTARGHAVRLRIPDEVSIASVPDTCRDLVAAMPQDGGPPSDSSTDLVLSLGGDGTFLRAARLARESDAPVIGINVGRLGFLAEIDPKHLEESLSALTGQHFSVEQRSTLEVQTLGVDGSVRESGWALNDVAVEKAARERLVRLEVAIGATPFASLAADAVIVATSTGSTAYALSAGGPIVNPTLDAMLIVPVAPHSLFDRTVVTDLSDRVSITVGDDQDGALVTTDGMEPMSLGPGETAAIHGGRQAVRVARLEGEQFFARVRRTFRLG